MHVGIADPAEEPDLLVRCPISGCREEVIPLKDLKRHLTYMMEVEEPEGSYERMIKPMFASVPLPQFLIEIFEGHDLGTLTCLQYGRKMCEKWLPTFGDFVFRIDPKMGMKPVEVVEGDKERKRRDYHFVAWWIHPDFQEDAWWNAEDPYDTLVDSQSDEEIEREIESLSKIWQPNFDGRWSQKEKPKGKYLHTLLDLRGEDLPSLRRLREEGLAYMQREFNIDPNDVKIYMHYPTRLGFSTLHIHFVSGDDVYTTDSPHMISRTHYLDDVIRNLESDPDYYVKKTFRYHLDVLNLHIFRTGELLIMLPHKHTSPTTCEWMVPPEKLNETEAKLLFSVTNFGHFGYDAALPDMENYSRLIYTEYDIGW